MDTGRWFRIAKTSSPRCTMWVLSSGSPELRMAPNRLWPSPSSGPVPAPGTVPGMVPEESAIPAAAACWSAIMAGIRALGGASYG